MEYLKRLKARHWAWLHFLAIIGVAWPVFMLVTPPELIVGVLNPSILAIAMFVSLLGSLTAMAGYFASQQQEKIGVIGVSIELSGLILSVIGAGSYFVTRVYMLFLPETAGELTSTLFFAYALCAVYLYRFVIIVPRFRFEAQDPSKDD